MAKAKTMMLPVYMLILILIYVHAAPYANAAAFQSKPISGFSRPLLTISPNPATTAANIQITAICPSGDICEIMYPGENHLLASSGSDIAAYTYPAGSLSPGTYQYYYAYDASNNTYSAPQALIVQTPGSSTNSASSSSNGASSSSNGASNSASSSSTNSASAITVTAPPPPQPIMACTLYGNSNYTNDWLPINYLVIITGFMVIAVLYAIGRALPPKTKSTIAGITKIEMTQLLISALIITLLLFFSSAACGISSSISHQLTGMSLGPFTYSDYYIGNLSMNTGLRLLTNIYSDSIAFSIDARVYSYMSAQLAGKIDLPQITVGPASIAPTEGYDLSIGYYLIADLYMDLFSPILVITIGMLFLQYLALPLIRLTAFALLLPVAIIIRSIAYTGAGGTGLRNVANAILAIAIALYLIYPLTIVLDAYMVHWIFSAQNPLYPYLSMGFTLTQLPSTFFSSAASSSPSTLPFGLPSPPVQSLISGVSSLGLSGIYDPYTPVTISNSVVNLMSQFIFIGVILFALNIAITVAFAMSLAKALNTGIEGAASFWNNL